MIDAFGKASQKWTATKAQEGTALNRVILGSSTENKHLALLLQIVRYGVSGGAAAFLYTAVYWVLVSNLSVKLMPANVAAWTASLISSYVLHSRWSFRNQIENANSRHAMARFLCVNLAGLALNSAWVWLLADVMKVDPRWPLVPILLITPGFMFLACRKWAFR